jgi:hypothetical protein
MKQTPRFALEPLELPPLEAVPSVSALVTNHNYAHYVGEALVRACSARLTDTSRSRCAKFV